MTMLISKMGSSGTWQVPM